MDKRLTVIIPVYNEEKTIAQVLARVAALNFLGWQKEIIVVDDGSRDNSKVKTQNAKQQYKIQNLQILEHEKNQGKGAAIKTGLKHATGEAVVIQDADLEYDPAEIQSLLSEFDGRTAIYGSRNLHPERRGYPHYVLGVWLLTQLINLLYRANLTDAYTGYKLFPLSLLKSLDIESHGFEFEAEVTCKILKSGYNIKEVPIRYFPRKFTEGKKIRFEDGLIGIWTILKNRN